MYQWLELFNVFQKTTVIFLKIKNSEELMKEKQERERGKEREKKEPKGHVNL